MLPMFLLKSALSLALLCLWTYFPGNSGMGFTTGGEGRTLPLNSGRVEENPACFETFASEQGHDSET